MKALGPEETFYPRLIIKGLLHLLAGTTMNYSDVEYTYVRLS